MASTEELVSSDLETITISKQDLKDLVDNLKVKHRAELDAVLIE